MVYGTGEKLNPNESDTFLLPQAVHCKSPLDCLLIVHEGGHGFSPVPYTEVPLY